MTRPLEGVRVLDLTVAWSGPGTTAMLGDLGAEVIRVEHNRRTSRQVSAALTKEVARAAGWHANMFPDRDPGERPYERNAMFNWHARNKLSVSMNLDEPEGHEAFMELVRISDVFVENNTVATLEKLGIGHDALLAANPRMIVVRMPPMGLSGELSSYLGYGPNFNALVGIAAMDGYEGEGPESAGDNYHMDEASPASCAFAILAALLDRDRTGHGALIEFAQAENVMQDIGEYFLDWQFNARNPAVLGNTDNHMLQDVLPLRGIDRWLAVSIRDDRDWKGLREVVGTAAWLDLGDTEQGRRENSAELRRALGDWSKDQEPEATVAALQERGIPAGEVMNETMLLADEHLRAREWFKLRSHPSVGEHRYPGHAWQPEGFELAFGRPLPGFGEDNEYVYQKLLGRSQETYLELLERKVISGEQFA